MQVCTASGRFSADFEIEQLEVISKSLRLCSGSVISFDALHFSTRADIPGNAA